MTIALREYQRQGANSAFPVGPVALAGAALLAGRLAARNLNRVKRLPESVETSERVSIIIPARNEAERIRPLLASLAQLEYPDPEVIVVDDGSTDGTAEVVRTAGFRVIRVAGPPPGWTGKAFACAAGARIAGGAWLLFTDADTVHAPESLGRAIAAARVLNADILSLLARQCYGSWAERLLLPYAYALYFVGASSINNSAERAVANGQYLLCRRDAYERWGGHEAVRGSITDDVSLARHAASSGYRVALLRGQDAVQVRMYGSLGDIWEGFSKNSFRFVRLSPAAGLVTAAATTVFLALPVGLVTGNRQARLAALTPMLALWSWYRAEGVAPFAALYPATALLFQGIALDSVRRAFLPGATRWKDRSY